MGEKFLRMITRCLEFGSLKSASMYSEEYATFDITLDDDRVLNVSLHINGGEKND